MKHLTPLKAIRAKCLDCVCFQPKEVTKCPAEDCPLWIYRMGKSVNRKKRILTKEQKETLLANLKRGRDKMTETTT